VSSFDGASPVGEAEHITFTRTFFNAKQGFTWIYNFLRKTRSTRHQNLI